MTEATSYQNDDAVLDLTAVAALTGGQVIQMNDGRAGIVPSDVAAGEPVGVQVEGIFIVDKTTSMVILDGSPVYWDHSANKAHYKQVSDRDFYLGTAFGDAASADTTMKVNLNKRPVYKSDLFADNYATVLVGTAAAGGLSYPVPNGGGAIFELTATNEAQKVDALGLMGVAPGSNFIVEGAFRVLSDGAGTAVDASIGIASGTHASDFQSVAEFVAIHLDANDTKIYVESDDGTTDVAPTDSLSTYTEGADLASRVHFAIDARDPSDVQVYVNGALVLGATVFSLAAAAGPLFPIVHVEKTSSTDTYKLAVDWLRVRTSEQD